MNDTVITIENLSKSYMVGHNRVKTERYVALRDVMVRNAKSLMRKTSDMLQGKSIIQGDEVEEFWALKDVSFEVNQGDRVGIIGRNGAGKSTLLKILSRITEPTKGRITIKGRVASLLEVGTGFHPELTGRENIFLNGAILGMSRKEIQRKYDEIVEFAEVEKFLDTPVKRYSSGMYVRLAFAVAAHLEPDILVVDEVLAVGDAQFQKKCLGKLAEVGKEGRTVLFVSHSMEAIHTLCNKGVLFDSGINVFHGSAAETISHYARMGKSQDMAEFRIAMNGDQSKSGITTITFCKSNGEITNVFNNDEDILLEIQTIKRQRTNERIVITLLNSQGVIILESSNYDMAVEEVGQQTYVCKIKAPLLKAGKYEVNIRLDVPMQEIIHMPENVVFYIEMNRFHQMGILLADDPKGIVHPKIHWGLK